MPKWRKLSDADNPIECLGTLPPKELLEGSDPYSPLWSITLLQTPWKYLVKPKIELRIPVIVGQTKSEWGLLVCGMDTSKRTEQYYRRAISSILEGLLIRNYPPSSFPSPVAALNPVTTNYVFTCQDKLMVDTFSFFGMQTFAYVFEHHSSTVRSCMGVLTHEITSTEITLLPGSRILYCIS
jgi:hypothetical protein